MFCPNCGTSNPDNAGVCSKCGTAISAAPLAAVPQAPMTAPAGAPARPNNYLVQAILVTLFCCLPLGIVSIVFAAQVNTAYDRGDYAGALNSSKQAKMWTWISFGIGGGLVAIWFLIFGLSMMGAIMGNMH